LAGFADDTARRRLRQISRSFLTTFGATAKLIRMPGHPPDTELQKTLDVVADRVERHRGKRIGEQNTKSTLIVPVLRALGWDVEDLDEVRMEYRSKSADGPVDYALLLHREAILFVEAKGLDEDLNDRRWASQIITYAMVAGVEWVVLTNGDEYRLYNAHAPVPFEGKLFRSVRVSANVGEVADALRLLTKDQLRSKSLAALWRAQSIDNRVRDAVERLFGPEPNPWLVRRLAKELDGLTQSDVKAALSRARLALDFPPVEPEAPTVTDPPPGGADSRGAGRGHVPTTYDASVKDLLDAGLIRQGARLRKRYLGHDLSATVEPDGRVRFGTEVFNSLSIAAGAARVSVKGPPDDGRRYYQTNGWTFWECDRADGGTQTMEELRRRYLQSRSGTQR
jgi:hypothetical protein